MTKKKPFLQDLVLMDQILPVISIPGALGR